jgi:microcystin-dependent protein
MLVTNLTAQDYWFGPLHLPASGTLTVDDTSATSLYLTDDSVADSINALAAANKITVSDEAQPFPRPTGTPDVLHGDGAPEGMVYGGSGSIYLRRDNGTVYTKTTGVHFNTGWSELASISSGGGGPSGSIAAFAGSTAPNGWLLCDGTAISRTTYADLFTAIGTQYGGGDGSTTFNLPDLRGRVPVGKGSNSAVSALGDDEGVAESNRRGTKHRHTPHSHDANITATDPGSSGKFKAGDDSGTTTGPAVTNSHDGGSGVSSDPLDGGAFLVINYIIKA